MNNRSAPSNGLVPLLIKLVWPTFIIILLLIYGTEARELYAIVRDRLTAGAPIKIGLLELGEQAGATEVNKLALMNIPIDAIGGSASAVEKQSTHALEQLRDKIKNFPHKRIDTLKVVSGKKYSPIALRDYVNTLGISFIVFEQDKAFDGWIDSGLFLSQLGLLQSSQSLLGTSRDIFPYKDLRTGIAGISLEFAEYADSAKQVLKKMQDLHVESLPILNDGNFVFFANRGEILSSLISSVIVEKKQ